MLSAMPADDDHLSRSVRLAEQTQDRVQERLLSLRPGVRGLATQAVCAAVAEDAYRTLEPTAWRNETATEWYQHLQHVWAHVARDEEHRWVGSEYRYLSEAVARYLVSPLNHDDGQDGPDDFDLPQTVAAYCAALAVVVWGAELAYVAVGRAFEAVDLAHGQDADEASWREVQALAAFVDRVTDRVVPAVEDGGPMPLLPRDVVAEIRSR